MKQGIVNIIRVLVVLSAVSGCSTTSVERFASADDRPILSAAEAGSMIRVEVRTLEPLSAEPAFVARTD